MKTKVNSDLRDFLTAYISCALWSSLDEADENGGEPLNANFSEEDLSFTALLSMARECKDFLDANKDDLLCYCLKMGNPEQGYNGTHQAGHDFWLTRNGHGAGFWDRGLGPLGRRLSDAAKVYGSSNIYVGDDGKLYVS